MYLKEHCEYKPPAVSFSPFRQLIGPHATELSFHIRPALSPVSETAHQTLSIYLQLQDLLRGQGGNLEDVAQEIIFFRSLSEDLDDFLNARRFVFSKEEGFHPYEPASMLIEQPPVDSESRLEILVTAVIPHGRKSAQRWTVETCRPCACGVCARTSARLLHLGGQKYAWAGNIFGTPGSAFDEALSMFQEAEKLLRQAGMDFRSVVRTWIYLRDIDADYLEFNRARREFFKRAGIARFPASTGTQGGPCAPGHNFAMGFLAMLPAPASGAPASSSLASSPAAGSLQIRPLTPLTMNEAYEYGSDFSRGLLVAEANKAALYISGTASVDEQGATVHTGSFDEQVRRMLHNISDLLGGNDSSFGDVFSAITYLKRAEDAVRLRQILRQSKVEGFPHAIVKAPLCRPDLLCEMEVQAALPLARAAGFPN